MTALEKYYNKFNEDHRLTTRHGTVEFEVSVHHIKRYLAENKNARLLDLGCGTGRYSLYFNSLGYDVTAVEPVKRNLDVLLSKHTNIKCFNGNALDLKMFDDDVFDFTIMFGPLYHLHGEDKIRALKEASRGTKKDGIIFTAHLMNEYAMLRYCFCEERISKLLQEKSVTEKFKCEDKENELYSYVRLEDIDALNEAAGLSRIEMFAPDGPSDYMRRELNAMSEETFKLFIEYQKSVSLRKELLGASSHVVDILRNTKVS